MLQLVGAGVKVAKACRGVFFTTFLRPWHSPGLSWSFRPLIQLSAVRLIFTPPPKKNNKKTENERGVARLACQAARSFTMQAKGQGVPLNFLGETEGPS